MTDQPAAGLVTGFSNMSSRVTPQIFEAMTRVMAEVRAVGKDGWNDHQKFKFRGIDSTVNAVSPALRKHGVIVVPKILKIEYRDVKTTTNKPAREVSVRVRYRFYAADGSYVDAIVPGEAMDSADKGTAKAMSVAFRIALLQALALPTDDTDPDATYVERGVGDDLPSALYLVLSRQVDDADSTALRRETYTRVSSAAKLGHLTAEEAQDLHQRLASAESLAAASSAGEEPVTVQRAVRYANNPTGPEETVQLPEWPEAASSD